MHLYKQLIITFVNGKVFWKKWIPLAIVFLFIVVALSPIYVYSNNTSPTHEHSAKYTPQIAPSSGNSTSSNAGYVKYTLVLNTNSLLNGNVVNFFNIINPTAVAYDPANQYMYVVNFNSNNVSVINSTTDTVVQSFTVGNKPVSVAYNPVNQYVYVVNFNSNNVSVINSTTDTVVQSFTVGAEPIGVGYDPVNQYMYVSGEDTNSVSVINSTTDTVVPYINVGYRPEGVAYDPANKYMYVANELSGSVSIISTSTPETYLLTFKESGLPPGTAWYVKLSNSQTLSSTTSTMSFTLANNSYFYTIGHVYGYSSNRTNGQIMVSGSSVQVSVGFTRNVAPVWAFEGEYLNYSAYGMNGAKPVSGYVYQEI